MTGKPIPQTTTVVHLHPTDGPDRSYRKQRRENGAQFAALPGEIIPHKRHWSGAERATYEAALFLCDGYPGPRTAAQIAELARYTRGEVRRALGTLQQRGAIRRFAPSPEHGHNSGSAIAFLWRDYPPPDGYEIEASCDGSRTWLELLGAPLSVLAPRGGCVHMHASPCAVDARHCTLGRVHMHASRLFRDACISTQGVRAYARVGCVHMHASLYIARSSQIIPDPSPLPPSPSEPSEAPQDGRREVLEIWIQDLWNTKLGHIDRSAIRRTLERLEELAGRPVPFEQFRTFYGEQSQDKSLLAPHIKSSFAVASSADRWGTFLRRIDRPKRLPPARREPPKLDESTKAAARRETTRMLDDLEDRELAGRIRAAARTWGKGAAE